MHISGVERQLLDAGQIKGRTSERGDRSGRWRRTRRGNDATSVLSERLNTLAVCIDTVLDASDVSVAAAAATSAVAAGPTLRCCVLASLRNKLLLHPSQPASQTDQRAIRCRQRGFRAVRRRRLVLLPLLLLPGCAVMLTTANAATSSGSATSGDTAAFSVSDMSRHATSASRTGRQKQLQPHHVSMVTMVEHAAKMEGKRAREKTRVESKREREREKKRER